MYTWLLIKLHNDIVFSRTFCIKTTAVFNAQLVWMIACAHVHKEHAKLTIFSLCFSQLPRKVPKRQLKQRQRACYMYMYMYIYTCMYAIGSPFQVHIHCILSYTKHINHVHVHVMEVSGNYNMCVYYHTCSLGILFKAKKVPTTIIWVIY